MLFFPFFFFFSYGGVLESLRERKEVIERHSERMREGKERERREGKSQHQIRGWGTIPSPPLLIQHNTQLYSYTPPFPLHFPLFLSSSSSSSSSSPPSSPTSSLVAGRQFKWTFNPNQGALRELAGLPSPKWRGKWIH